MDSAHFSNLGSVYLPCDGEDMSDMGPAEFALLGRLAERASRNGGVDRSYAFLHDDPLLGTMVDGEESKLAVRSMKSGEGAVGAGDFGEEVAELGGVFDAGAGFDAAGNVHGIGADGEDGLADVFGREAAG